MPDNSRLVYSTDGGRVPGSGAPAKSARGRSSAPHLVADPQDGVVRLRREKGGRRGNVATTVTGLPGGERELDGLLKQLKEHLGTGGSRSGRTLEIQGDHRERIQAKLEALGHKVKLAGG